jgi:hypothetical protein
MKINRRKENWDEGTRIDKWDDLISCLVLQNIASLIAKYSITVSAVS